MTTQSAYSAELDHSKSAVIASVAFAVLLGSFLIFGVAFAQPEVLHNAAHDSRHAFSFPCH